MDPEYEKFYNELQQKLYIEENKYKGLPRRRLTDEHICYNNTTCSDTTHCVKSFWGKCEVRKEFMEVFLERAEFLKNSPTGQLVVRDSQLSNIPIRDILNDLILSKSLDEPGLGLFYDALHQDWPYATLLALFYIGIKRNFAFSGMNLKTLEAEIQKEVPLAIKLKLVDLILENSEFYQQGWAAKSKEVIYQTLSKWVKYAKKSKK